MPLCYARDGDQLYFVIDEKPKAVGKTLKRMRNIAENPDVALVVDVYDEDWTRLAWVIVEGRAVVLTGGEEFSQAVDLLTAKYPQYRTMGLDRHAGAVIAIAPERLLAWRAA